jgi:Skp family chaperone for outer membrane proteins
VQGAQSGQPETAEGEIIRDQVSPLLTAQKPATAAAPTVAVIDVNDVARRVGMMDQITLMVEEKQRELEKQFALSQQRLSNEYEQTAQLIPGQPTAEERNQLLQLQQTHMRKLTSEWNALQDAVVEYHNELKDEFMDSVRPIAFAVAKNRGITTVLTTKQVFSVDERCDITVEVATEMRRILTEAALQTSNVPATETR